MLPYLASQEGVYGIQPVMEVFVIESLQQEASVFGHHRKCVPSLQTHNQIDMRAEKQLGSVQTNVILIYTIHWSQTPRSMCCTFALKRTKPQKASIITRNVIFQNILINT